MAKSVFDDPVALWRDMFDKWERQLNEAGNKLMGTEQFGSAMNASSIVPLQAQKLMGEFMAKYFARLNLPTRDDIRALSERLHAIEEALQRLAPAPSPKMKMPPRTRKPGAKPAGGAAS